MQTAAQAQRQRRGRPGQAATMAIAALAIAATTGAGACKPPPPRGRARVMQTQPTAGETTPDQLRDGVRLIFDRDAAPPNQIGKPVVQPALKIEPPIAGETRWLDSKTLAFFPREKLQPSTAYTVSLARGIETAGDVALDDWGGLRFVHDRVAIRAVTLGGERDFAPVRPVVTVLASHAVAPTDAAGACAFLERRADGSTGASTAATPATPKLTSESGGSGADPEAGDDNQAAAAAAASGARALALTPASDLRAATAYVFRCDTTFRPARGAVGLAKTYDEMFATHGAAGVKKVAPTGNDVAADGVKVTIEFATPMNPADVRAHVALEPAGKPPQPLDLAGDRRRVVFTWSGDLEPDVHYVLHVDAGLKDVFGQAIAGDSRYEWTVGDASPRLRTERGIYVIERALGRYPVFTRNLPAFDLRCTPVPEARLAAVLTGPANYDAWWDAQDAAPLDYAKLGLRPRSHTIKPDAARNRWHDNSLDLGGLCGGGAGASGVYLMELTTREELNPKGVAQARERRTLASVTDLGLLAKVGNASSLVWVVRLSTGEPVAGATVKIRDLNGKVRFTGRSGADGTVDAPGASKLIAIKPRGDGDGGDEGEGEWEDYRARRVLITAQAADDLAVLDTNWNNGIQIWNFAVDQDRRGGAVRVRGFLHSDRGLYRPGDTAHLHGMARVVDVAGAMALPRKRRVHVTVADPRGTTVVEKDLPMTSFGGFALDVPIADESRLGDYAVRGQVEDQTFTDTFSVEEYRPRTFEVTVKTPRENTVLGRALKFELGASYLYGSPLRAAKVTWNVRRRLHIARFPGFDDYVFQDFAALNDMGRWWARDSERSFSEAVADGEIELDASGKATVVARDSALEQRQPQDYLFEATVEDPSGQAVTAGRAVTAHESDLYLGLHPSEFVQAVEMPFGVQVVGFDREGKRRAADAELTLTRRTYDCGVHGTNLYYSCTRNDDKQPAVRKTLAVPASGSAAVERIVLQEPGEYVVRVTASDGHGHSASAADTIYVIGAGEAFWSGDEGDRMTLIASKSRYRPGEVARLVPQAQLKGAYALATLERDGILWHKVQQLASTGEAVEIPVEPRLAPNAFASVALVRGRTGEGDGGRPRFKMGLVNLEVESSDKRLSVAVETDRASYRPGDKVTARLRVAGADGAPARAELAVAVADEGVLQIKGFKTPDPMGAFYAPWGLGVESSTTWNRILRRHDPTQSDDEEGGDAGGDEAGRIRSRFLATAFWAPAVVTGADGTATVTFTAPDNLTAFRVMAVGGDTGDRFGSGERRFTINKPLQASPALPRFLTVGDHAEAAVLLANNTKAPIDASVSLRVAEAGVALTGPATQTVKLAPGGNARVAFPIQTTGEGVAKLVFRASGGGEHDAVEVTLPVQRPAVQETIVVGEGVATGKVTHDLPALGAVVPGHGGLEIALDTSGLSRLDEGLRYLVGYPYGCLEQTTSKVVPMVALGELSRTVDLPGFSAGKARGFVQAGLAKILRFQHEDGGFGLWIGAPAEAHYTAYALWGLHLARTAGYKVDDGVVNSGAAYLKRSVDGKPEPGDSAGAIAAALADHAFAHYVLAVLGKADVAALTQLYEARARMPIFGRAFLARALREAGPAGAEMAAALAGELAGLVPGAGGPVIVHEGQRDLDWYWNSDVRSTALVLSALLAVTPAHPAVRRLEQGLLAARVDGRWSNTQENVYGLVALAELGRARAAAGDVAVTVTVGAGKPARRVLHASGVERVRVPLGELGAGKIVIESGGGEVFYAARLQVERPLGGAAAEHGLRVERAYLNPDNDQPLAQIRLGQTIKVKLTVQSPVQLAHVAVVDRLPAGFEPVLTRFQRTSNSDDDTGSLRRFWWNHPVTEWQNLELRDDRAQLFADLLAAGESSHTYLARATSVGTFAAPPLTAEAMYQPQIAGRSATGAVVVVR